MQNLGTGYSQEEYQKIFDISSNIFQVAKQRGYLKFDIQGDRVIGHEFSQILKLASYLEDKIPHITEEFLGHLLTEALQKLRIPDPKICDPCPKRGK